MKTTFIAIALGTGLAGAALAAPVQWTSAMGGNDHWYEYVSTPMTWQASLTAAASSTHMGMQGYLATLTSAGENTFASTLAMSATGGPLQAWFGLTDEGAEGVYRWASGPEVGQIATFFSWTSGEPNDCCNGEDYVHTNWGGLGLWNDHGGPTTPTYAHGYLVEYSTRTTTVPEPMTLALVLPALLAAAYAGRRRA